MGKHARHRRQVADVAVDHAKQRDDGCLVRGDRIEVAHGFELSARPDTLSMVIGKPLQIAVCQHFRPHNAYDVLRS
jgi:hypothetical protein